MRYLVMAVLVGLLVGCAPVAVSPEGLPEGRLVLVAPIPVSDGSVHLVGIYEVEYRGQMVEIYRDEQGVVFGFDLFPTDPSAPIYLDQGFCPDARGLLPAGAKPTKHYIPMNECPKPREA